MVYRVRKQLVEEGLEAVLSRKPRATPAVARIFDGEKEAKLIALACSKPPKGRARWTLRLLENKVVELEHRRSRQRQHDRAGAQKNILQPHRRQHWVIPPKANSAFVAAMEDVLAVYTRPRDPDCPLVCLDETSKQLIAETRAADPDESGTPGPFRLRIRAQRHRQSLHDVRAARRLAPCQSHGSPHRRGLRSRLERLGRYPLRHTPRPSFWSRTISTSTARLHSTKLFRPPKPGGWSSASNGTTLQSTAAGSIWPSPNSASYPPSASIAASPTNKP